MYSRYHRASETPIQLPENYGGIAFSERAQPRSDIERQGRTLEVAKPSPPMPTPTPTVPPTEQPDVQQPDVTFPTSDTPSQSKPTATDVLSKFPLIARDGFPFAHGIGFEELFIIALIILLSKSEESPDVVLWLTLLLFCG